MKSHPYPKAPTTSPEAKIDRTDDGSLYGTPERHHVPIQLKVNGLDAPFLPDFKYNDDP